MAELVADKNKLTNEEIESFMNGRDPMERIVNLTYKSTENTINIYYRDENDNKVVCKDYFKPFVWATLYACRKLCGGDKSKLLAKMREYGIGVKKLRDTNEKGETVEVFKDGYMFMFYALSSMSYQKFLKFFKECGFPIHPKRDKSGNAVYECEEDKNQFLAVTPQEQYLISSGKRFFKGYGDYNELLRMVFDLETTGLNFDKDQIKQLGVSFNRPFGNNSEVYTKVFNKGDGDITELTLIEYFLRIISVAQPDVVCGHNIENFDIPMFIGASNRLGEDFTEMSKPYFNGEGIKKSERETILKLGSEIETFRETSIPNTTLTDSLHAVRRAQALDSNMLKADLKYASQYAGLVKKNRVYTPGDKIDDILTDTVNKYAFNDSDGDWYIYDPDSERSVKSMDEFSSEEEYSDYIKSIKGKQGDSAFRIRKFNNLADGYVETTGKYIIERYLFDDLWEADKVEWKYNSTNFLISKMIPVPYKKCTTMGTAGQWKSIMLAWSYENDLAVPMFKPKKKFTGGLSRLLKTGHVKNVIKLDYNSLYPSITLTWGICDVTDLMGVMLKLLEFILTGRETYKGVKKKYNKIVDGFNAKILDGTITDDERVEYNKAYAEFSLADGKQNQFKCFANSFFGSFGATDVFPHGSLKCAEQITCTGRQCLRLMISHFKNIGYDPIVGDSVTGDTPLFVKYNDSGFIDIKPISEIMDDKSVEIDTLGREYDYSDKPYKVLCRTGWSDVNYVYRHSTTKPIYNVSDDETGLSVDVTEDHSLFTSDKVEIKPSEIKHDTKLEYYKGNISDGLIYVSDGMVRIYAKKLAYGIIDRVPVEILNCSVDGKSLFLKELKAQNLDVRKISKTCKAGILYIENSITHV